MKRITVIGGGNMGFTYAESIYNSNLEATIQVLENSNDRIEEINALNSLHASSDVAILKVF